MSDRNMIIATIVGTGLGIATLLVTVALALHSTAERNTNRQIDALTDRLETRITDLRDTMNTRFDDVGDRVDDVGDRVDDLGDRTTKVENDLREIRTLLIEQLRAAAESDQ